MGRSSFLSIKDHQIKTIPSALGEVWKLHREGPNIFQGKSIHQKNNFKMSANDQFPNFGLIDACQDENTDTMGKLVIIHFLPYITYLPTYHLFNIQTFVLSPCLLTAQITNTL